MEKARKLANKKIIPVLVAVVLLLIGAIWLNISLNNNDTTDVLGDSVTPSPGLDDTDRETSVSVYNDYFNSFRTERSAVRAQEIDYLRSMLNADNTDEETITDVQNRLLELVNNMEKEFTIESQIRSKGFLDAAVTFQGNSVTVVIDGESLTEEEVARILDIVVTETGMPASNIKISLGG